MSSSSTSLSLSLPPTPASTHHLISILSSRHKRRKVSLSTTSISSSSLDRLFPSLESVVGSKHFIELKGDVKDKVEAEEEEERRRKKETEREKDREREREREREKEERVRNERREEQVERPSKINVKDPNVKMQKDLVGLTQKKRVGYGKVYIPEEDSIRNNYSIHYLNTGLLPQNYIANASLSDRFSEYPKLRTLLSLKSSLLSSCPPPSTYLSISPLSPSFPVLPTKFDSILITPPPSASFEELCKLRIGEIGAVPGFCWIWVGDGSGEGLAGGGIGLEKGRELLQRWGYRRCEDIVWLKTNRRKKDPIESEFGDSSRGTNSIFNHSKEHCLMGIRGTVRRSTDSWFVHCNIDTDVIVWEGDEEDPSLKPPELYSLIESFCLGTRRLDLFGSQKTLRRGWLTIGEGIEESLSILRKRGESGENDDGIQEREVWREAKSYEKEEWESYFDSSMGGSYLLPVTQEIESLRPKSPPPRPGSLPNPHADPLAPKGLGRGRGTGGAVPGGGLNSQGQMMIPGGNMRRGATQVVGGGMMLGPQQHHPQQQQQQMMRSNPTQQQQQPQHQIRNPNNQMNQMMSMAPNVSMPPASMSMNVGFQQGGGGGFGMGMDGMGNMGGMMGNGNMGGMMPGIGNMGMGNMGNMANMGMQGMGNMGGMNMGNMSGMGNMGIGNMMGIQSLDMMNFPNNQMNSNAGNQNFMNMSQGGGAGNMNNMNMMGGMGNMGGMNGMGMGGMGNMM